MHQLVVGGAELRVTGVSAETCPVNQGLGVLDTEPDREGLGLDEDTATLQHAEDIAKADVNDLALIRQLGTFLYADLLLVEAVKAEAAERGLCREISFPRWVEAAANWRLQ